MNPSFWHGKRVLVTGHTGFKGAWLSLWLQAMGADVTGYALAPATSPNLYELAAVGREMRSVLSDVRDAAALRAALLESKAEIVFHLAAQALVRPSYEAPVDTFAVNVMGTVNVLEAVRTVGGVRAVVNVTTDKCYDNREWLWPYRESDRLGGHDPYSSSKACAELVTSAFRSSYFKSGSEQPAVATARAGNVVGGGDWSRDRLIPDLISAFSSGSPGVIRRPTAIRPWQHVLDPLCGYLLLAERLHEEGATFAEAWNFGPAAEQTHTVQWVAEQLATLWGAPASVQAMPDGGVHEAGCLSLDASKARSRLGWYPRLDIGQALAKVVKWSQLQLGGRGARDLTLDQITEYQRVVCQSATFMAA